jgi:ribosomal protein L11 methyltransferase
LRIFIPPSPIRNRVTVALRLPVPADLDDLLVAELAERGFEAFAREGDALVAYGPVGVWDDAARAAVGAWLSARGLPADVAADVIAPENWNARWEASIAPVAAGPFVVAPTWAEPGPAFEGRLVLRVDPKMSFGTGHHPSTRLALALLAPRVPPGARVLDVGTGTGVLAFGALKLGAASAVGCDIDPWSVPNAAECAALNGVADRFEVREGDLDAVPEADFDLVLANIIRSVLVPMLPALAAKTAGGGHVVLAGLLTAERAAVLAAATAAGLTLADEAGEGEWWACALRKGEG